MIRKIRSFLSKVNRLVNIDLSNEIHKQNYRDHYAFSALCDINTGVNKEEQREKKIIVSLTTYGERIHDVHKTIQSLFMQTLKADHIILWLADDEFSDETVPLVLNNMKKRGLEIKYCENLKSYKKLIPALSLYPEDIIITVDDDVIYPYDLVENLFFEHLKHRNDIIFTYGKKITFNKDRLPDTYNNWEYVGNSPEASFLLMSIGVGGVLYPPRSLDKEVTNKERFMELAPFADDLWFKAMAVKKGTKHRKTSFGTDFSSPKAFLKKFITIEDEQASKLGAINVLEKRNDIQFKAILDYYKLWDILLNDNC